jgi:hypothetical protein
VAGKTKTIKHPWDHQPIEVRGGFGWYIPQYTFMGMTGHADVDLAPDKGHIRGSLMGPWVSTLTPCLSMGNAETGLSMSLEYDFDPGT